MKATERTSYVLDAVERTFYVFLDSDGSYLLCESEWDVPYELKLTGIASGIPISNEDARKPFKTEVGSDAYVNGIGMCRITEIIWES